MTYRAFFPELASANHWSLEINHHSHFHLGKLLGLFNHLDEYFMLLVLNGRHVYSENVRALINQFAYSFLKQARLRESENLRGCLCTSLMSK